MQTTTQTPRSTPVPARMRAIVQDAYGSPDVLRIGEIPTPTPADGEVLVRVHAAGVSRGVWHLMTGRPYVMRIAGFGLRRPKQPVPGADLAGRVEAIGPAVTRFKPGDEVMGVGEGAFAEWATAREDLLTHKPANLTFEQAAAVPDSATTALQALRDQGRVRPGQKVLVIGASGGVGSYAVQLARAFGAEVTGVAGPSKADLVRGLGAQHVIDYTREDIAADGSSYDVILDIGGNRSLSHLRRALAPRGTLVIVGGEGGGRLIGGTDRQLRAMALSPFLRQSMRVFVAKPGREDLETLAELIEAGKVTPAVDRAYPLAEAADALRRLEQGGARGKLVVSPGT